MKHDYYVNGWSTICGWSRWAILSNAVAVWAHDSAIVAWVQRMKAKGVRYT